MTASLFAVSGNYFGFLVRDLRTGELILPVCVGAGFELKAENSTTLMAAFPARLGTSEGDWLNLFAECEVTDPARMPSTGGMLEAMPNDSVAFDGLQLPGSRRAPFVVNAGGTRHNDRSYDRIEVSYRFPSNPDAIPGVPVGARPKGRDVSIGTGPVVDGGRTITDLAYEEEAHLLGVVRLVDRVEMTRLLAEDGLLDGLNPEIDQDWSITYLRDLGFASSLTDINVGTVGTMD